MNKHDFGIAMEMINEFDSKANDESLPTETRIAFHHQAIGIDRYLKKLDEEKL